MTVPAGGAVQHVEALDPSIADARLASLGVVSIRGIRPGDTSVLLVIADGIIAWPVHVTPAPTRTVDSRSDEAGWAEVMYQPHPPFAGAETLSMLCENPLPGMPSSLRVACDAPTASGTWAVSFQHGDTDGAVTPGGWHLHLQPQGGVHVSAASYFPTPLQDFGVAPTWGVDARTRGGFELIDTPQGVDLFQHVALWGTDASAGTTPLGPMVGVQLSEGAFAARGLALLTAGQVVTAGALTLRAGDTSFTYAAGPTGNALAGRLTRYPLDFTVSLTGVGPQVGLAYDMRNGQAVQASWSSANGFQLTLTAPLGEVGARTAVTPGAAQAVARYETSSTTPQATVPVGPGSLALTESLPAGRAPFVQVTWPLPRPLPAAAPAPPASVPSATLIVRACVSTRGDGVCTPSDPPVLVTVLVDGKRVATEGVGIPVPPGQHVVTIPEDAVPPLLVPVHGLTCDLTIPDFSVGICEVLFQPPWAAAPGTASSPR